MHAVAWAAGPVASSINWVALIDVTVVRCWERVVRSSAVMRRRFQTRWVLAGPSTSLSLVCVQYSSVHVNVNGGQGPTAVDR